MACRQLGARCSKGETRLPTARFRKLIGETPVGQRSRKSLENKVTALREEEAPARKPPSDSAPDTQEERSEAATQQERQAAPGLPKGPEPEQRRRPAKRRRRVPKGDGRGAERAARERKRRGGAEGDAGRELLPGPRSAPAEGRRGGAAGSGEALPSARASPELPFSEERGGRSRGLQRQRCPPSSLPPRRGARDTFSSFGGGRGTRLASLIIFHFQKHLTFHGKSSRIK